MHFREINKNSPVPYYYQLEQFLREKIENGKLKPGDNLPSEAELCSIFGVSRTVVRQALNKLNQDGIVYKEKGRGTFVAKPKLQEKFIQRTYGFYQEMKEKGLEVESRILEHELIEPPTRIKTLLKLTGGQKVVKTSRLRLVNKELIMFTTTYVRSDLCPGLEKEDLTNRSLYQLLWDKYRLKISYGQRTLEAVAASKYEANMLKVPRRSPLVYLESVSYLEDGTPIEYFEAWHRGDKCKFAIELVPAEEMKKIMPAHRENFTFWSGIPSKQTVSLSDRTDK
ncbi:MAG: GntR family transcriptional regulator [bacterium]